MLESYLSYVQIGAVLGTFMLMFSIGLNTTFKSIPFFKSRLRLFGRSILAVSLFVPLIVVAIIFVINPEPKVAILMAILAASPVAPMSFIRIPKAGGDPEYIMSLNLLLALLAIVTTPLILYIFETIFNFPVKVSSLYIAVQISLTILLPVFLGMFIRRAFPDIAKKVIQPLFALSNVITLIAVLVIVISTLDDLFLMTLSSYLSMFLMVAAALLIGHMLAKDTEEERTTLALECAFRNPGLALMIASLNFPDKNTIAVLIPYILIFLIISTIYIRWRKRYVKAGNTYERPV